MVYKYRPKTKEELVEAIKKEIYEVQGTKKNPNWNADLNCIDTSLITDMYELFAPDEPEIGINGYSLENFNGNISKWNVSNVENMSDMFAFSKFNQNISNWDVSNVTNMSWMFEVSNFNGDISKWDVSNVTNMEGMFYNSEFNKDISKWNVSNVEDMNWMFKNSKFNGDISNWDVSNVKDMGYMFADSEFNGDISNWDVSNVENMSDMFVNSKFNGDISNWDVSNVKDMSWMFKYSKFNQDIGSWPLKETTGLENISVFPESNKLPNKIVFPETMANIFIRSIKKPDNTFNIDNFKKLFKKFLNNRKKLYKNKGYKPDIANKLVLNDIADILKYLKDKDMQEKFMKITINKNKEPDINIS